MVLAMPYAIIDSSGTLQDVVGDDVNTAIQAASQFSPFVQVENGPQVTGGLEGLGERKLDLKHPDKALARCGVKPMRLPTMSLDEAWKRLHPYFPKTKSVKGKKVNGVRVFYPEPIQVPIKAYNTPFDMARHILGQNYKTAKEDVNADADYGTKTTVKGLSLLPAESLGKRTIDGRAIPAEPGFANVNACVGASAACIAGCLVYSGHNDVDPYNALVKAARYKALRHEPQAFVRMMSENIRLHSETRNAEPYVRLNVFSDLPWELICPELFSEHPNTRFYDYTKVANRDLSATPNYDLTFSFSGDNKPGVAYELNRGRRIAVVFIPTVVKEAAERARGEGLRTHLDADALFGSSIGSPLEIVDGDVSDVRPRDGGHGLGDPDDKPVIVGLRWKIPMGRQEEAFAKARASGFAIDGLSDGSPGVAYAVPVEEFDGLLIAATSARNEPIHDADAEDDEDEEG